MKRNEKDPFIEEVDRELRSIDTRLKKALSKTEEILKEDSEETQVTDDSGDNETG
ncbi:MAG: hypothetical protein HWN68_16725 [Desulfobacterales bacterium]|nr:hypothetical protein [Desulfobacterales bacterium]